MDADEITFEDLLAEEPGSPAPASSFAQLLADGFPHKGGLAELAAIVQLPDPGPKSAALRQSYRQILEGQAIARSKKLASRSPAPLPVGECLCAEARQATAPGARNAR